MKKLLLGLLALPLLLSAGHPPAPKYKIIKRELAFTPGFNGEASTVTMERVPPGWDRVRVGYCAWTFCGGAIDVPPFGRIQGPHTPVWEPTWEARWYVDDPRFLRFGGDGVTTVTAFRSPQPNAWTTTGSGARVHLRFYYLTD